MKMLSMGSDIYKDLAQQMIIESEFRSQQMDLSDLGPSKKKNHK